MHLILGNDKHSVCHTESMSLPSGGMTNQQFVLPRDIGMTNSVCSTEISWHDKPSVCHTVDTWQANLPFVIPNYLSMTIWLFVMPLFFSITMCYIVIPCSRFVIASLVIVITLLIVVIATFSC